MEGEEVFFESESEIKDAYAQRADVFAQLMVDVGAVKDRKLKELGMKMLERLMLSIPICKLDPTTVTVLEGKKLRDPQV